MGPQVRILPTGPQTQSAFFGPQNTHWLVRRSAGPQVRKIPEAFALVIRRTVLHDQSVLAIRRTMQINSQPMEVIIYFLEVKWQFT